MKSLFCGTDLLCVMCEWVHCLERAHTLCGLGPRPTLFGPVWYGPNAHSEWTGHTLCGTGPSLCICVERAQSVRNQECAHVTLCRTGGNGSTLCGPGQLCVELVLSV